MPRHSSRSPNRHERKDRKADRSRSPNDRIPRGRHSAATSHDRREADRQHHDLRTRRDSGDIEVDLRRVKQERPDDTASDVRNHRRQPADLSPRQPATQSFARPVHRAGESFRDQQNERRRNDQRRVDHRSQKSANDQQWGRAESDDKKPVKKEKEKPSLELSGNLTADTNTFRGVVIKYNEPPEARKPKRHWRFYPFKGEEQLPVLHLHRQSAFLLGRDRRIADIPVDHPSCSKQHAVFQFRLVDYKRADGNDGRRVRPYIIDLGSANGTYVNNQRIEPQRYVELMEKDVVKFGFSSREYVLLHEGSDTSELQDDQGVD